MPAKPATTTTTTTSTTAKESKSAVLDPTPLVKRYFELNAKLLARQEEAVLGLLERAPKLRAPKLSAPKLRAPKLRVPRLGRA